MDVDHKLEQYRAIVQELIIRQATVKPANGDIESQAICDTRGNHYMVMALGWDRTRRVLDPLIYVRLHHGKVWVEEDGTDANVVEQLLAAGIPATDMVIGFHHPEEREFTEFAVA